MTHKRTERQRQLLDLIGRDATHIMADGGSRSGKTFQFCEAIIARALSAPNSRHGIFRFRLNDVHSKIVLQTWPNVMQKCFPGLLERVDMNSAQLYCTFPNKSEVWFGGLDDKERAEKVLGHEFATAFLNECSQIPWGSRNMVVTRLAQKCDLRLKMFYDANPPSTSHWTYKLFVQKRDPESGRPLPNPLNYATLKMNPEDNRENLPSAYFDELAGLPERQRRRFLLGLYSDASEGALWSEELLDQQRHLAELPTMQRIVVAVDPSGCRGPEDTRSDEIGIIVCGLGVDQKGYVLADLSGRMGPAEWGERVAKGYDHWEADRVLGESNFGGAMVEQIVRSAKPGVPYREVHASRGKVVRAEPVSALFEQGKVFMAGRFEELETQLCAMTQSGYTGTKSPDRADAMVFALTDLFPSLVKKARDPMERAPQVIMQRPTKRAPIVQRIR